MAGAVRARAALADPADEIPPVLCAAQLRNVQLRSAQLHVARLQPRAPDTCEPLGLLRGVTGAQPAIRRALQLPDQCLDAVSRTSALDEAGSSDAPASI